MHLLTNKNLLSMGPQHALQPGVYLCEDLDAAQLVMMAGGGQVTLSPFECSPPLGSVPYDHTSAETITIVRPGRYGDLLLLTPVLRELKLRYPKCTLQVSTLPGYRDAIIGLPYVDNFLPYPLPMDGTQTHPYGTLLSLEVLSSLTGRERELHMTDLFAERLGVENITDKKPHLVLSNEEVAWALDVYPRIGKTRVAVQIKSSTPSRNYPTVQMGEVVRRLHGRGWEVMFLGLPNEVNGETKPRLVNCAADKLTFRQSAAVVATADVFLGPDSSLIHVAGALGVPAIGLFSVVPHELRTAYCPTTKVMQASKGCDIAPCFHAPRGAFGFPAAGPCQKDSKCSALAAIDPHDVVVAVESWQRAHKTVSV